MDEEGGEGKQVNLAQLRTEFYARGFAYLNDGGAGTTRANQFINQGYQNLMEEADYPFDETTATGVAPLTITDLRDVIYVSTASGALEGREVTAFLGDDPSLSQSGTAAYWYLDGSQLKVWPADTHTSLTVRYTRVPVDLAADTDTPVVPSRYHLLIIDFAVIRALRDKSNFDEASALRTAIDDDLRRLRETMFDRGVPWFQRQTNLSNA